MIAFVLTLFLLAVLVSFMAPHAAAARPSTRDYMRRMFAKLDPTPHPYRSRITNVQDMRTGEAMKVRTVIEIRSVRSGRVRTLWPVPAAR